MTNYQEEYYAHNKKMAELSQYREAHNKRYDRFDDDLRKQITNCKNYDKKITDAIQKLDLSNNNGNRIKWLYIKKFYELASLMTGCNSLPYGPKPHYQPVDNNNRNPYSPSHYEVWRTLYPSSNQHRPNGRNNLWFILYSSGNKKYHRSHHR